MKYATGTEVPIERSRAEIERMIHRFGASRFGAQWDRTTATIAFEYDKWRVRFVITLPSRADFVKTEAGRNRNEKDQARAYEAEERRRWRSLALVIKAKIEAVQSGVSTFTDEFFAMLVLANGHTLGEHLAPQLEAMRDGGKTPPLLPKG